jgi:hypothetical protein
MHDRKGRRLTILDEWPGALVAHQRGPAHLELHWEDLAGADPTDVPRQCVADVHILAALVKQVDRQRARVSDPE